MIVSSDSILIASDIAPLNTISPFLNPLPLLPSIFAAQVIAFRGWSNTAALDPVCSTFPFFDITMPTLLKSVSLDRVILLITTTFFEEQLSAMTSTNVNLKALYGLLIISNEGAIYGLAFRICSHSI